MYWFNFPRFPFNLFISLRASCDRNRSSSRNMDRNLQHQQQHQLSRTLLAQWEEFHSVGGAFFRRTKKRKAKNVWLLGLDKKLKGRRCELFMSVWDDSVSLHIHKLNKQHSAQCRSQSPTSAVTFLHSLCCATKSNTQFWR